MGKEKSPLKNLFGWVYVFIFFCCLILAFTVLRVFPFGTPSYSLSFFFHYILWRLFRR